MGMIKPAAFGTVGGVLAPMIPVINTLPYSNAIGGAAGGYIAKRSIAGAVIGGLSGLLISPIVRSTAGSYSGTY